MKTTTSSRAQRETSRLGQPFQFLLVAATILFSLTSEKTLAQGKDSDKVDLKKLEDKYWAAKDDDFAVVQNRAYPKAKRFYASLLYGPAINDGFENGNLASLSLGWYLNERWGFEFNYTKANMSFNGTTNYFLDRYGTIADHNRLESSKTLLATFVPFYAKMSFMDTRIVYFDIAISAGLGVTDYSMLMKEGNEKKSGTHYAVNVTQHLFINETFALRLDFTNKFTSEQRSRYELTGSQTERSLGSKMINDSALLFGITLFGP